MQRCINLTSYVNVTVFGTGCMKKLIRDDKILISPLDEFAIVNKTFIKPPMI